MTAFKALISKTLGYVQLRAYLFFKKSTSLPYYYHTSNLWALTRQIKNGPRAPTLGNTTLITLKHSHSSVTLLLSQAKRRQGVKEMYPDLKLQMNSHENGKEREETMRISTLSTSCIIQGSLQADVVQICGLFHDYIHISLYYKSAY